MKLIVHGTDGSAEAREALALAIDLAKETGAELAVVSVHVVPIGGKGVKPPVADVEQPHGAEHLAGEAAATARAAGVKATTHVVTGEPARAIADAAEDLGADLIVVGSRGFGAIHGALVGSVSRGLITRSKVPVTVVAHRPVRETAAV
jgi:nucleotide-binding universal stress UspA family protein